MAGPGVNGFVVGKSFSIQIVTPQGQLSIPATTSVERKPMYAERTSTDITGTTKPIPIPLGWGGTIDADMVDDTIDAFIAAIETNYYQGQGIQPATITETRTDPNGNVSQYMYVGVMFTLGEGGTIKGDDKTTLRLDWKCSRRNKTI